MRHLSKSAVALALFATALSAQASRLDEPESKISPALERAFADSPDGGADMLVVLAEQADLAPSRYLLTGKAARAAFVYERLTETARRTQAGLLAELENLGAPARSFWAANFVWTRGDQALARMLAERDDVARIDANPRLVLEEPSIDPASFDAAEAPDAVEWNLTWVNADDVWALGFTGQGAVIGGQDTGYQWDHPALKAKYRGWNGAAANHNYNWHDAIHSGGGSCGANATAPCDDTNHGTHTMGTMVGDDGGANQIGMAPGAKWIGCRNMDQGIGTPTTYIECFQWFLAPTDLAGGNPDPTKSPDVINNSWGCPVSEGCNVGNFAVMQAVVENVRAAGIFVAVSAGNDGSACSTVNTPAAIYDASFSVGATGSQTDAIAGFSSRGPVTVDGSNRMKPDISAPGSNIRSSVPGSGYEGGWNGTSMAGPHVAGLVGLMISAVPGVAGDVDRLEDAIRATAVHPTFGGACGVAAGVFPNNTFGSGRIDALAAVNELLSQVGFTVGSTPASRSVCAPSDATFNVNIGQYGDFSDPVTLSLAGEPAGTTEDFSVNPVTPPGSSTLTIGNTGSAAPGTYPLTITGTAPGPVTQDFAAELRIFNAGASTSSLVAPADGATGVSTSAPLSWSASAGATDYAVEVDDDNDFSSPEYAATVPGTSTIATGLAADTIYFWRVRAFNVCGGAFSAARSFHTALEYCASPNLAIPDVGSASTNIVVPPGAFNVADLNIGIEATHTWVGDVTMTLAHGVDTAVFFNRPGFTGTGFGCSGDDVDVIANDEGADGSIESQCGNAPAIFGDRVGGDPASASLLVNFDGASMSGTWTLTVQDSAAGDIGTLDTWCLYPALDTLPFIDGFDSGNPSAWVVGP